MPSGAHASHQNHGRKPKRHCRHDDEIAGIVQQLETMTGIQLNKINHSNLFVVLFNQLGRHCRKNTGRRFITVCAV